MTPLPIDIFTSKDFYKDVALWTDKRYYRCNSPMASEVQRGILSPNPLNTGKDEEAPWGHCDRDLPREAIVSPYGFKTAQEHYEALLAETKKRGGPNTYTFQDFPAAEWNGVYENPARAPQNQMNWYWGANTQISTVVVAADSEVSAARGAGGVSPDARPRDLAVDVLLARGFRAAVVPVLRMGALRRGDSEARRRFGRASRATSSPIINVGRDFNMADVKNGRRAASRRCRAALVR